MKKLALFCVTVTILFAGCVSTKTYDATLDESGARQTQLEKTSKELVEAKKVNSELSAEVEGLMGEKSLLSGELESMGLLNEKLRAFNAEKAAEIGALMQQEDYLEREVDRFKAKAAEIRALMQQKDYQKDYLEREVDRLKVKAGELSAEKEHELANVKQTYDNLVKEMRQEIEQGDIKITQAVDKLSVNFVEKILFDSGKDRIKPAGLDVLKRVGDILKGVGDRQIRVEGHTDNVPIGSRTRKRFPTNWELSTARATRVVRYLRDQVGISPDLLSATGYADNRPVADNETFEGRAQNRRIEIVLLPLDIDRVLKELKK